MQNNVTNVEICLDPFSKNPAYKESVLAGNRTTIVVNTNSGLSTGSVVITVVAVAVSFTVVLLLFVFAYLYLAHRRSSPPSYVKKRHKYEVCVLT